MPEKGFNLRARRVCPVCKKPLRRNDSYSQQGADLYHFHCRYPKEHRNAS